MAVTRVAVERTRLEAVVLPDGALWIPGELAGQLAAVLRASAEVLSGRPMPASCAAVRPSRDLLRLADAAAVAAEVREGVKHRAAAYASISAQPSSGTDQLFPSAQVAGVSDTVTVAEASALMGVTPERVRQLAAAGRIKGQRTARRVWMLERASVASQETRRHRSAAHGSSKDH